MYLILISDKANKQLKKLPKEIREIILNKIYSIRHDPFRHVKKLKGSRMWRLRIMDHRTVVNILAAGRKVFVLTVDKRERVY